MRCFGTWLRCPLSTVEENMVPWKNMWIALHLRLVFWGLVSMEGQFRVIPMSFDSVHQTFDAIILLHSHKTWNNSNLLQSVNQHLKKCINLTQVLKIDWRTRHRNVTLVWQNSSEHRDTVPVVFQIVATQNLELYIHVPFSWGCYISFPGVWNLMV